MTETPINAVVSPEKAKIQDVVSSDFHPSLEDRAKLSASLISIRTSDLNSSGHFLANSGDIFSLILSSAALLVLFRSDWIFSSIRIGASSP